MHEEQKWGSSPSKLALSEMHRQSRGQGAALEQLVLISKHPGRRVDAFLELGNPWQPLKVPDQVLRVLAGLPKVDHPAAPLQQKQLIKRLHQEGKVQCIAEQPWPHFLWTALATCFVAGTAPERISLQKR